MALTGKGRSGYSFQVNNGGSIITGVGSVATCRLATTGNIAALAGGAPLNVDGNAVAVDDIILVWQQAAPTENGPYRVVTPGGGANGTWVRAPGFDTANELNALVLAKVREGTLYQDSQWDHTTNIPITLGITNITFDHNDVGAPDTITVGTQGADWTTITAAMAVAAAGDRVKVDGGTFTESFTIPAGVTLDGPATTVVGTITTSAGAIIHLNTVTGDGVLSGAGLIRSHCDWTGDVAITGTGTWDHRGDVTGDVDSGNGTSIIIYGDLTGDIETNASGSVKVYGAATGAEAGTGLIFILDDRIDGLQAITYSNW